MYESSVLGKRGRLEGDDGNHAVRCDDQPLGKKAKGWKIGDVPMLSGLSKVVSVVSEALTSFWRKTDVDRSADHVEDGCIDCGYPDLGEDVRESSEDTDTKYQRILSTSTIERPGPATVELSMAKPVKLVSRVKLKQQLLDKISSCPKAKREGVSLDEKSVTGLTSSRGARMLKLLPKTEKTAKCDTVIDVKNTIEKMVTGVEMASVVDADADISDHAQEEVSLVDMADCSREVGAEQNPEHPHPVVFSESPKSCDACNDETISRAMEVVENLVADLGMADEACAGTPRMLFFGDEQFDNEQSSLDLIGLTGTDDVCEDSTGDFAGFHAVTPMEARNDRVAPNFSPLPCMLPSMDEAECMVIENHNADLSPEECNGHQGKGFMEEQVAHTCPIMVGEEACQQDDHLETEEPISSAAAKQGSLKSAKALLRKRMTMKQAEEETLFTRLREVVVNHHLAEMYGQGHAWARLDARGIELNSSIDHALVEEEVVSFVRQEKGDDILKGYLSKIEKEWEHISNVRQKYSTTECGSTPIRSILKQSLNSQKSVHQSQTLRWALENVHHRYPATEAEPEDHQALRRPSSTRGLRMLLASASPNVVVPSPKPNGGDHEGESLTKKHPTNRRSRSRTGGASSGRASQGQRLFQALQQGSCAEQQIHAPRTLSMIFDRVDDENECFSNMSNSMTTSDNTTSSNSSSRGGIPVGGRWTAEEVTCLIQAFKESIREDPARKNIWKKIIDMYRGRGISEYRTSVDIKDKWKNLRRTAMKNVNCRYVKLDEETLAWLKSNDAKPQVRRQST